MIATRRLRLRRWNAADLPALQMILGCPLVMAFSDHGPLDGDAQKAWLNSAMGIAADAPLPDCFAVERSEDARVIGYVSLKRSAHRVGPETGELGIRLAKAAWGQGYATEAAHAIIDTQRMTVDLRKIVALVDPNNRGSLRMVERLGMVFDGEVMFDGYDYPDRRYALHLG